MTDLSNVKKWGHRMHGVDPRRLPDQRYVHYGEDGVTADYPSAFMPPAINDFMMGELMRHLPDELLADMQAKEQAE